MQDDVENWQACLEEKWSIGTGKIKRCIEKSCTPYSSGQLHIFCDASEVGYGAVVYCRFNPTGEKPYCSLIIAKSRVAPLKTISIPRLELSAAQLGVRIGEIARKCMILPVESVTYWTDSTIVLYYIRNNHYS